MKSCGICSLWRQRERRRFAGPGLGGLLIARLGDGWFWSLFVVVGLAVAIGYYSHAAAYGPAAQARQGLAIAACCEEPR